MAERPAQPGDALLEALIELARVVLRAERAVAERRRSMAVVESKRGGTAA